MQANQKRGERCSTLRYRRGDRKLIGGKNGHRLRRAWRTNESDCWLGDKTASTLRRMPIADEGDDGIDFPYFYDDPYPPIAGAGYDDAGNLIINFWSRNWRENDKMLAESYKEHYAN